MNNINVFLRYCSSITLSIISGIVSAYFARYVFVFGLYDGEPILTNKFSYNIFIFLNAFFPSFAFGYGSFWAFTQSIHKTSDFSIKIYFSVILVITALFIYFASNKNIMTDIYVILGASVIPAYLSYTIINEKKSQSH